MPGSAYTCELFVDDVAIAPPAYPTRPNTHNFNVDGTHSTFEFTEYGLPSFGMHTWNNKQKLTVKYNGTFYFGGRIYHVEPAALGGSEGFVAAYTCNSWEWIANEINITNSNDLSARIQYNLPITADDYIPTNSNLSLSTILMRVLDAHMTQLNAAGITGYTAADFAPLTVAPNEPVQFFGPKLWNQLVDTLADWQGRYWLTITAAGAIRVLDSRNLSPRSLSLGSDDNVPCPSIRRHVEGIKARWIVRGERIIKGVMLAKSDGDLSYKWSAADEANWRYSDFTNPKASYDTGTVISSTATQITYHSDNASSSWSTNFWAGASVYLKHSVNTGIDQFENRDVLSNSALVAGGNATVDLSYPLPTSGWNKAKLVAKFGALSGVWRDITITNTYIADHLCPYLLHPAIFIAPYLALSTMKPLGWVGWSPTGAPPLVGLTRDIETIQAFGGAHGYYRFLVPIVQPWNSTTDLESTNPLPNLPTDVLILAVYSAGVNTAVYPPDVGGVAQYAGTAYTVLGLAETGYHEAPDWVDPADVTNMQALAQSIHETSCDEIFEGSVVYNDLYVDALAGIALSLPGAGFASGYEAMAAPVRGGSIKFNQHGEIAVHTAMNISNQRQRAKGERIYFHEGFLDVAYGGFANTEGGVLGPMGFTDLSAQPGLNMPAIPYDGDLGGPLLDAVRAPVLGQALGGALAGSDATMGMGAPVEVQQPIDATMGSPIPAPPPPAPGPIAGMTAEGGILWTDLPE